MATGEQIKALVKSHFENNSERFSTTALQVAAHEARQGHEVLAKQIRDLVQASKSVSPTVSVIQFKREISDLILCKNSNSRLNDLILTKGLKSKLKRVLVEYRQQDKLKSFGLNNRRKLLLVGPPGTGKTLTAAVLAGELRLPLMTILMDKLITKYMGETGARLRQIFETIQEHRGVYLFDEFDTIGADRCYDNDVGEMRRILNSFLMFIENDASSSIIVAATNNLKILDQALFRRFDDVLFYDRPHGNEIERLIKNKLASFLLLDFGLDAIVKDAEGLSHAEIGQACEDALKDAILKDEDKVTFEDLSHAIQDRRVAYNQNWRE